jgi:hypothetical protein
MRQLSRFLCVIAVAGTAAGCSAACGAINRQGSAAPPAPATPEQRATAAPGNPDSATLADFNARLENYVKVQRGLAQKTDTQPKESSNPAEIEANEQVLASAIRNVRKNAKQGDIFAPAIADMFKRLMAPELKGAQRQATRETLEEEDGEVAQVNLRVNAAWPESEPLTTVPANILERLPQLPRDVEYRISAKRHLVLRDVDANIIVDFIYNAIR